MLRAEPDQSSHRDLRCTWSLEEENILLTMASEGKSASKIAACVGRTRNAVIGRSRRMKLQLTGNKSGNPNARPKGSGKPISIAARRTNRVRGGKPDSTALDVKKMAAVAKIIFKEPVTAVVPRMVKLMDLQAIDCRFPIGDPRNDDFGFCAHPVAQGSSYCPTHMRLAIWNGAR